VHELDCITNVLLSFSLNPIINIMSYIDVQVSTYFPDHRSKKIIKCFLIGNLVVKNHDSPSQFLKPHFFFFVYFLNFIPTYIFVVLIYRFLEVLQQVHVHCTLYLQDDG